MTGIARQQTGQAARDWPANIIHPMLGNLESFSLCVIYSQVLPSYVHVYTELMVSLFIRCTMRCEIWAQPAELPR